MEKKKQFGAFYQKTIGKIIPQYAFFSLIWCFVFNSLIYTGTQILMRNAKHIDLTTDLDRAIPFWPEWVWIYVICFGFWGVNYILITRLGQEEWFRFAVGDYLSRIICGIFFVIMPTTNVRPEVFSEGLTGVLMKFIYSMDAPTNLFPSIHCLVSWFCYIGIRGKKEIPVCYRAFSCIFALLVCASTQFTKQHYFIDIIAGIGIAELCYYIGHHTKGYRTVMQFFAGVNRRIMGTEEESLCSRREKVR